MSSVIPDPVAIPASPRLWTRPLVEMMLAQFLFGLSFSAFYLLPKFLKVELHAGASAIGAATGVGLLAAMVASPPAALWMARGQRRAPALVGAALLMLSALGYLWVDRVDSWLMVLRVMGGAAYGLTFTALLTRTSELAPPERLGQVVGYLGLAMLVTNALSPALAEQVATHYGWTPVFLGAGVCALASGLVLLRVGDLPPPDATVQRASTRWSLGDRPKVLFVSVVLGVALGVMFTFTQPLAIERGAHNVSGIFTGYVVMATTVRIGFGTLADRWGRRRVSRVALFVYALVVAASAWLTPDTLFVFGLGLGLAHGIVYPALGALLIENATAEERGSLAAAFNATFTLGYGASVLGLGVAAERVGYPAVLVAAGLLTLLGALVLGPSRSLRTTRTSSA